MNARMIRVMVPTTPPRRHALHSRTIAAVATVALLGALSIMVFRLYEFVAYLALADRV